MGPDSHYDHDFLAHRIKIPEILPWDRKSYLTHAILPRTSSNVIMINCILSYSGTSGSLNKKVVSTKKNPLFV